MAATAATAATAAIGLVVVNPAEAQSTYTCIPVGYYDDGTYWWLIWAYYIIPRQEPCGVVYELVGTSC